MGETLGTLPNKDKLVREYIPRFRNTARNILARIPNNVFGLEEGDVINAGMVGLLDAYRKYDPSRGVQFSTYAGYRIRGEIIELLRVADPLKKAQRQDLKLLEGTANNLMHELEREPSDKELAKNLGWDINQVRRVKELRTSIGRYDEDIERINGREDKFQSLRPTLEDELIRAEKNQVVAEAIEQACEYLSPRNIQILKNYCYGFLTEREIGQELGITESRVCQVLHNEIAVELALALGDYNLSYSRRDLTRLPELVEDGVITTLGQLAEARFDGDVDDAKENLRFNYQFNAWRKLGKQDGEEVYFIKDPNFMCTAVVRYFELEEF